MAQPLIPEAAVQAMDDTAAWAVSHMPVVQPANRADDATVQQCYDALQQSLAHFRRAGRKPVAGIDALHADEVMELPIVGLLAVLMTGTDEQALIARRMLRDDALEINYPAIAKRAAELQAVVQ